MALPVESTISTTDLKPSPTGSLVTVLLFGASEAGLYLDLARLIFQAPTWIFQTGGFCAAAIEVVWDRQ